MLHCRGSEKDGKRTENDLFLENIKIRKEGISLFRIDGSFPSFSPDGDRIAYVGLRSVQREILFGILLAVFQLRGTQAYRCDLLHNIRPTFTSVRILVSLIRRSKSYAAINYCGVKSHLDTHHVARYEMMVLEEVGLIIKAVLCVFGLAVEVVPVNQVARVDFAGLNAFESVGKGLMVLIPIKAQRESGQILFDRGWWGRCDRNIGWAVEAVRRFTMSFRAVLSYQPHLAKILRWWSGCRFIGGICDSKESTISYDTDSRW
ncbi:hypothetical protein Tco_0824285 [Tanacetum coccineum]|uniref:Uncharacterized protein n=1 Tax=Tanacetum coccineum TaxID=301880 RepID=A0ABQ5ALC3_9ASTR